MPASQKNEPKIQYDTCNRKDRKNKGSKKIYSKLDDSKLKCGTPAAKEQTKETQIAVSICESVKIRKRNQGITKQINYKEVEEEVEEEIEKKRLESSKKGSVKRKQKMSVSKYICSGEKVCQKKKNDSTCVSNAELLKTKPMLKAVERMSHSQDKIVTHRTGKEKVFNGQRPPAKISRSCEAKLDELTPNCSKKMEKTFGIRSVSKGKEVSRTEKEVGQQPARKVTVLNENPKRASSVAGSSKWKVDAPKPTTSKPNEIKISGESKYKCQYCEKIYCNTTLRKSHEKKHTEQNSTQCSCCNKIFLRDYNRKMHEMIHTGEKSLKCFKCEKSFKTANERITHELFHIRPKSSECQVYRLGFSNIRSNEGTQKKIGNFFKCPSCTGIFTDKPDLKRYDEVHLGKKIFKCQYCKKQFKDRKELERHERIHVGDKPFVCHTCGKKYTCKDDLRRHQIKHKK